VNLRILSLEDDQEDRIGHFSVDYPTVDSRYVRKERMLSKLHPTISIEISIRSADRAIALHARQCCVRGTHMILKSSTYCAFNWYLRRTLMFSICFLPRKCTVVDGGLTSHKSPSIFYSYNYTHMNHRNHIESISAGF
jgi:hypothetical protein